MVNHVHLRDIRSKDLDLSPTSAQVHQDPIWRKSTKMSLPKRVLWPHGKTILQMDLH